MRLAGLVSGAKLELAQASRSPSVVSVALQIPDTEAKGFSNRIVDKFASNTTVWMILRQFESLVGPPSRNFTGRSTPVSSVNGSGGGRLHYETPVIQVMGRELSSLPELQSTLAQLGFNHGSALLRLTFRTTQTPLEDALHEIGQYFTTAEKLDDSTVEKGLSGEGQEATPSTEEVEASESRTSTNSASEAQPSTTQALTSLGSDLGATISPGASSHSDTPRNLPRDITIFSPTSSNTPKAAQQPFNEKDYEPTVDHAKLHQSRLAAAGTNKRLLSDAEISAQAEAKANQSANVQQVQIKVRFPDQMQALSTFSRADTAKSLYGFVRSIIVHEHEPFELRFSAANGFKTVPIDSEDDPRLIGQLGMVGRVLVNMIWAGDASIEARTSSVLKAKYGQKAQVIEANEVQDVAGERDIGNVQGHKATEEKSRKGGVPKWLKLPGKK